MEIKTIRPLRGIVLVLASLCSLFILLFNASCEKDDICVDGDTPLLVIQFYDIENPETTKTVTRLRIVGQDKNSTVNTFTDRSTQDSIGIPLRINQGDTSFLFISESEDNEDGQEIGNTDNLRFQYNTQEVYISRACGFIANYSNLSETLEADTDNWIKDIEIVSPEVQNQTITHVKIYH